MSVSVIPIANVSRVIGCSLVCGKWSGAGTGTVAGNWTAVCSCCETVGGSGNAADSYENGRAGNVFEGDCGDGSPGSLRSEGEIYNVGEGVTCGGLLSVTGA